MVMLPGVKQWPLNGSYVLKMEELWRMTVSSLTDLQNQDLNLWLPRWKTSSSTDCPKSCKRGWSIHWFMPQNFNERFRNALRICKNCAKTLDWWSETATFSICENLPPRANDKNILKNVIIGDKRCVYGYDTETKQQSSTCKSPASPRPKKAWWVKAMLLVFLIIKALCIMNSLLKVRQLNKIFMWQF
jgi:hypothetical protein